MGIVFISIVIMLDECICRHCKYASVFVSFVYMLDSVFVSIVNMLEM